MNFSWCIAWWYRKTLAISTWNAIVSVSKLHVLKQDTSLQNSNLHLKQVHGLTAFLSFTIFYRATACNATHGIARNFCPYVHPSVRLSVKRVHCDRKKETCAHILVPHERTFIPIFIHEECLLGTTPCTWKFGPNQLPSRAKKADFQSIFHRSASTVTHSQKR